MTFNGAGSHVHSHFYRRGSVKVPSDQATFGIICTIQSLAMLSTCIRLIHRAHRRKLWWDDFWAAVALISDGIVFVFFLISRPARTGYRGIDSTLTTWMTLLAYVIAVWTARLTMSVTITRLLPEGRLRKVSKFASTFFTLFCAGLLAQKIEFCAVIWKRVGWKVPQYAGILELITDILADLWLLAAPAAMLVQMKLRRAHRRMIRAIFACGALTLLASAAHAVFIIRGPPIWIGVSAHIQLTTAIAVSNLIVLVTAAYRALRRRRAGVAGAPTTDADSDSTSTNTSTNTGRGAARAPPTETARSLSHLELTGSSALRTGTASFASTAPVSSFSFPSTQAPDVPRPAGGAFVV